MKNITNALFAITAFFVLTSQSNAQVEVDLDLQAKMKLVTTYSSKKKKITGSKTSGLKQVGTFYPSMSIKQSWSQSQESTFPLSAYITDGSTTIGGHTDYYKNIRNIGVHIDISEDSKRTKKVILKLDENRPLDKQNGIVSITKGKKNKNTWTGAFSDPTVSGTIRIAYTFPENTWLVRVVREKADNILSLNHLSQEANGFNFRGMVNSLNANLDPALVKNGVYIWAKPGTKVYQQFNYNNQTADMNGDLEFTFEPVKAGDTSDINTLIDKLSKALDQVDHEVDTSDDLILAQSNLLAVIAGDFGSDKKVRELVETLSTKALKDLVDRLGMLRDRVFSSHKFADSKIAATILSSRIATMYLKDLFPFCETTVINLPYQNTQIKTSWLTVSNFLLRRVKTRLDYHSVEHFQSLLTVIEGYQTQGLTYAQVRKNAQEYKKIKAAYKVLTQATDLESSPFTASLNEINYILGNVGTLGSGDTVSTLLTDSMKTLTEIEKTFVFDLSKRLHAFQLNNDSPVDISDLKSQVQKMEISVGKAIDALETGSQLVSISTTGLSSLLEIISNFGFNHVQVYAIPVKGDFEYFRKMYFDEKEIASASQSVNKCLLGE